MIITFCGHSNYASSLEDEERLLKLLEGIACGNQVDFYLGGYGSFDAFALKCATKYKQSHKNAKLVFITPYLDKWLNERKDILEKCYDEIVYPEIERVPQKIFNPKKKRVDGRPSGLLVCLCNNTLRRRL